MSESLAVGRSVFTPSGLKIHHYRGSVLVADMTNAGKRGKKVREFTFAPKNYGVSDHDAESLHGVAITELMPLPYDAALAHIKRHADIFRVSENERRGIDVEPPATEVVFDRSFPNGTHLRLTASPSEFRAMNSVLAGGGDPKRGHVRQDTLYYSVSRVEAKRFYDWLLKNLRAAERMGLSELQDVMRGLGVRWDYQ